MLSSHQLGYNDTVHNDIVTPASREDMEEAALFLRRLKSGRTISKDSMEYFTGANEALQDMIRVRL